MKNQTRISRKNPRMVGDVSSTLRYSRTSTPLLITTPRRPHAPTVSVSAAVYGVLTRKTAKYQAKTRTWLKNIMLFWGLGSSGSRKRPPQLLCSTRTLSGMIKNYFHRIEFSNRIFDHGDFHFSSIFFRPKVRYCRICGFLAKPIENE